MNDAALLMPTMGAMPSPDGGAASRLNFGPQAPGGERFSGMLREQRSVVENATGAKPAGNQTGRKGGEISPPSGNDLPESPSSATANTAAGEMDPSATGPESKSPATALPPAVDGKNPESEQTPAGMALAATATVAQPLIPGLFMDPKILETGRSQAPASAPTQADGAAQLFQSERALPGATSRGQPRVVVSLANGAVTRTATLTDGGRGDSPLPGSVNPASLQGSAPSGDAVLAGARPLSAGARLALARTGLFTAEGAANRMGKGAAPSVSGTTGSALNGSVLTDPGQPALPVTQSGSPQGVLQQGLGSSLFGPPGSSDFAGLSATSREFSVGSEFSSVLQGNLAAASPRPVGTPPPALNLASFVGQPGWSSELGQRVSWMAGNQLREAQLQLHPRSLGPVEVRIAFGPEQQLTVNFSATHAVAREALEAALPRLREMFDQQGLNLGQADVSRESFAEQQRRREQEDSSATATGGLGAESLADGSQTSHPARLMVNMAEGLLDAYA